MLNQKNDEYYLNKIKSDLIFICEHMKTVEIKEFIENEILLDSMMFRMIQISENSKRLSEECKNANVLIPWAYLYGMRNRIVHDYGSVDYSILYSTLKKDIPELLELLVENKP